MPQKLKMKALLVIGLVIFCTWVILPFKDKINLGLDLQGGMFLTLRVDMEKIPEKASDDLRRDLVERTIEVIRKRIDQFGVREPQITRQGVDRIIVQLPGVTERQRAIDLIGRTAQLEFHLVADEPEKLQRAIAGDTVPGYTLSHNEDGRPVLLENTAVMTGDSLANAFMGQDQYGRPDVKLEFTAAGAKQFANITGANVNRQLAIVLDGDIYSAPVIRERISGGNAQISGSFTAEQAKDLATVLRTGALPASVEVEEERTVGALLGADSIHSGILATLLGGAGVIIFMILYYFVGGMLASVALILNVLIILAALVILKATLTLPGIAGIGLTIGMAVDANVLINERIREEMRLGKSLRTAITNGYGRAFPAILDSNVTTIIAAALLAWLGSGPIRGFGTTLIIGLLASMFTAIVVTRLIFDIITLHTTNLKLNMLQLIPETKIDFMKMRKGFYLVSVSLVLIGLFIFAQRGENNYGIDFTGGALQEFQFSQPVDLEQVRGALREIGLGEAMIQQDQRRPQIVMVRTDKNYVDQMTQVFAEKFSGNTAEILRVESVGPVVGGMLKKKAALAMGLALLAICLYIWIRFRDFAYGVAGVISLFHDVLVGIAVCALTHRPVDLLIVTALMTIAGYSINDTIVTYDRMRENLRLMRKTKFYDIINISINQTLGRTVWTTVTTVLVVLSIFLFGGEVLHNFAFILLIGFVSGAYSTVFIASPLVYALEGKK